MKANGEGMDDSLTGSDAIDGVYPESVAPAKDSDRSQAVTLSLLDAAVEVFAESGFEAARVAEIARRAGLTTGAIYARWRGKRALLVDAVGHVWPQFADLPAHGSHRPAPETLAALGASLIDAGDAKSRDVLLEAFVSARRDDEFRAAVTRSMEQEADGLRHLVAGGKAQGLIDPEVSARVMVAFLQSLRLGIHLVASASDLDVPRADWERLIARLAAAVIPAAPSGPPASGR